MVGGSHLVAKLTADETAYLSHIVHSPLALKTYKIKTEDNLKKKSLANVSGGTTVVDLGKQLLQYARENNVEGVKTSISRGAPYSHDWLGMTALHFAAMNNQYEICEILLNGGINKDAKTKVDRTPLHIACYYGNEQIVQLLLTRNSQVNALDMLKMSALHWAVEKRFKTIVRLLLKYNADVTMVSKFGKTPIALAVLTEQADILEDLQRVRSVQLNKKFNEEREKETSQAVNSIMNLCGELNDNDLYTKALNSKTINMPDHYNISTIHLLESHGISLLPNSGSESKDLLTAALNNGRQLILSEEGKLLLNETRLYSNKVITKNRNIQEVDYSKIHYNDMKCQTIARKVSKNNVHPSHNYKIHYSQNKNSNIKQISTPSDAIQRNIGKNKSIRIISLNDFKKIYGNKIPQPIQGIQHSILNNNGLDHGSQIMKTQPELVSVERQTKFSEDIENDSVMCVSSDTEKLDIASPFKNSPGKAAIKIQNITNKTKKTQFDTSSAHMSMFPKQQVTSKSFTVNSNASLNTLTQETRNKCINSTVVPLLTTPQICRQLLELRKQNEELKRKYDLAQKQRDDLRLRVERLEALLLLKK